MQIPTKKTKMIQKMMTKITKRGDQIMATKARKAKQASNKEASGKKSNNGKKK